MLEHRRHETTSVSLQLEAGFHVLVENICACSLSLPGAPPSQVTTRSQDAAQQAAGNTAAKKTNERKPRKARAQRRSRPDPEACLQFEMDPEFDDPVQDNAVVIPSKIDRVLPAPSGLGVPTVNPSAGPKSLEVLEFIDRLREYENLDRARLNVLMKNAFKGDLGQKWYHRFGGDYELLKNKLLNWMMHCQEWLDLNAKLVRGERFSDDMETHIRQFKLHLQE